MEEKNTWDQNFTRLAVFKEKHGHCCPSRRVATLSALVRWIDEQRQKYEQSTLEPEREQRLDDLGFCWDLSDEKWETHFVELVAFKKKHGHCTTPYSMGTLGNWVSTQRQDKAKGRIDPKREQRLDALGFSWNRHSDVWETRFAELVAYKKQHSHCNVPISMETLGRWAHTQRQEKTNGRLDPTREQRLDALGFSWSRHSDVWETRFAELVAYKKKHGHCCPLRGKEILASWVGTQRYVKAKGLLDPERERRLNALGFSWNSISDQWETRFTELVAFKKKHGHCCPPRGKEILASWVGKQRYVKAKGLLDPERERRLNALGFLWDLFSDGWETHFVELVAFNKKHGHCNPPLRMGALGKWVNTQRTNKTRNRLEPERERRLEALGFSWDSRADNWEARFAELVAFNKKHGHVSPPKSMGTLGAWVSTQRINKTRNRLEPERERRLEALGFVWRVTPGNRNRRAI